MHRPSPWRRAAAVLSLLVVSSPWLPSQASAGGLYYTDRGARSLGRGQAQVAGADDGSALWVNPAGLTWAGQQIFFDAMFSSLRADYTRIDSGGNVEPTVSNNLVPFPLPMIAYSDDFGLDDWTFGFGLMVPNMVPLDWPETVVANGEELPGPTRYALISQQGSAFAHLVAGAAWQPADGLSIGASVHLLTGTVRTVSVSNGCDRFVCTQPENPEHDGLSVTTLSGVLGITAIFGVIYAHDDLRFGASFMLPHSIAGSGDIETRLPSASVYDGAYLEADGVHGSTNMPWVLRGGVEIRPTRAVRIEAAAAYEGWSVQDSYRAESKNAWVRNTFGLGDVQIGSIVIPRNLNDVVSLRLGTELAIDDAEEIWLRAGLTYENSSVRDEYLTAAALDSDKYLTSVGASFEVADGFFVDASYAHVFMTDRTVLNSQVPIPGLTRPEPSTDVPSPAGAGSVGNGHYAMEGDVFGLGIRYVLGDDGEADAARAEPDADPEAATEPEDVDATAPEEIDGEGSPAARVDGPDDAADTRPAPAEEPTAAPQVDDRPWYLRGRRRTRRPARRRQR